MLEKLKSDAGEWGPGEGSSGKQHGQVQPNLNAIWNMYWIEIDIFWKYLTLLVSCFSLWTVIMLIMDQDAQTLFHGTVLLLKILFKVVKCISNL